MPKVLVAPGSGDVHWVMLKMQGMISTIFDGKTPEVWAWSEHPNRNRARDYIERIPFVKWGGYFDARRFVADGQATFVHGKPWFRQGYRGFDVFVAFNHPLEHGQPIESLLPDCTVNWDYPIEMHEEDLDYAIEMRRRVKDRGYVLCSFYQHSFYAKWLREMGGVEGVRNLLRRIVDETPYTPVLVGKGWDRPFMQRLLVKGVLDWIGRTDMGQFLGLCSKARAFIGMAAGNGMLAQHLGCKTYLIWGDHFASPRFVTNWVKPSRRGALYKGLHVNGSDIATYLVKDLQ